MMSRSKLKEDQNSSMLRLVDVVNQYVISVIQNGIGWGHTNG